MTSIPRLARIFSVIRSSLLARTFQIDMYFGGHFSDEWAHSPVRLGFVCCHSHETQCGRLTMCWSPLCNDPKLCKARVFVTAGCSLTSNTHRLLHVLCCMCLPCDPNIVASATIVLLGVCYDPILSKATVLLISAIKAMLASANTGRSACHARVCKLMISHKSKKQYSDTARDTAVQVLTPSQVAAKEVFFSKVHWSDCCKAIVKRDTQSCQFMSTAGIAINRSQVR